MAVALLYVAFLAASHSVPFNPGWEPPLMIGGWLFAAVPFGRMIRGGRGYGKGELRGLRFWTPLRGRRDLVVFGVIMGAVIAAGIIEAVWGNRSMTCVPSHPAATCLKVDEWYQSGGSYFHRYPYTAQGDAEPDAPWVAISRGEYVAEVGTRLRSAASSGVLSLGVGALSTVVEEGAALALRGRLPSPLLPITQRG